MSRKLDLTLNKYIESLLERYPVLEGVKEEIISGYLILEECFENGHKLLIAGNGGSAADAEHIAGELMKGFKLPRSIDHEMVEKLINVDSIRGKKLSKDLQGTLMTIALTNHEALTTAYINDVDADEIFAQQLYGYGREGDVFLAISTSGNSKNIMYATVVAQAQGIKILGLTGEGGGELSEVADVSVRVPASETYIIQELHLPIYHCWCLMLEKKFF